MIHRQLSYTVDRAAAGRPHRKWFRPANLDGTVLREWPLKNAVYFVWQSEVPEGVHVTRLGRDGDEQTWSALGVHVDEAAAFAALVSDCEFGDNLWLREDRNEVYIPCGRCKADGEKRPRWATWLVYFFDDAGVEQWVVDSCPECLPLVLVGLADEQHEQQALEEEE